MFNLLSDLAV